MSKIYSLKEVSQHNQKNDLWIAIHGGVYDLTKFLQEHPGGEEVLISLAGEDGSKCFDDIGHSFEAITLRESFKIGEISDVPRETLETNKMTSSEPPVDNNDDDDNWTYEEPKKQSSPYLPIFIGLSVLIYAIIFYHIWY